MADHLCGCSYSCLEQLSDVLGHRLHVLCYLWVFSRDAGISEVYCSRRSHVWAFWRATYCARCPETMFGGNLPKSVRVLLRAACMGFVTAWLSHGADSGPASRVPDFGS